MSNGKLLPDVDTMRLLGPKEGKRGESMLENIVYRVNNKFLPCKYQPLYIGHNYIGSSQFGRKGAQVSTHIKNETAQAVADGLNQNLRRVWTDQVLYGT